MDEKRSVFIMNPLNKTQVDYFTRLVLDYTKIPKGTKIFSLGEKKVDWFIDKPFALRLRECGFEGVTFQNIKNYGAEFRSSRSYTPDPELGY